MESLSVVGIRPLVQDVSFIVPKSRIVALYGPSGAGKSTTLLGISGLLASGLRADGNVMLGNRDITTIPPEDRSRLGLSIVLQGLALFPHLTVVDNVAYPLMRRGIRRAKARAIANTRLESFRLMGLGNRLPSQLSGGEQQRVAIARAMVSSPSVLLLDEPFKGLDQRLRDELLGLVIQVAQEGTSILLVTHERREIDLTADVVILMRNGKVEGVPEYRSANLQSAPFRAVDSRILMPPVGSFAGGWVRPDEVRVVPADRLDPSMPCLAGQIVSVRNIGNGRMALLCRYSGGVLGWLETEATDQGALKMGGAINIEFRQQNGV